jgi:hypothetical protein
MPDELRHWRVIVMRTAWDGVSLLTDWGAAGTAVWWWVGVVVCLRDFCVVAGCEWHLVERSEGFVCRIGGVTGMGGWRVKVFVVRGEVVRCREVGAGVHIGVRMNVRDGSRCWLVIGQAVCGGIALASLERSAFGATTQSGQ